MQAIYRQETEAPLLLRYLLHIGHIERRARYRYRLVSKRARARLGAIGDG